MLFTKKDKQKVVILRPLEIIDKLLDIKKEVVENISYDKYNKGHERYKEFRDKWVIIRIDELIEKAKLTKENQKKVNNNQEQRAKSRRKNKNSLVEEQQTENGVSNNNIALVDLAMKELECIKNMVLNNIEKLDLSDKTMVQTLNFNEHGQYIALASEKGYNLVKNTEISSEEQEKILKTNEKF